MRADKGWLMAGLLALVAVIRLALGQYPVVSVVLAIAFAGGALYRWARKGREA
jgi:hypothetical protein